jgi:cell division protein FtsQ
MKAYAELIRELDSRGARYSQDLSEVDLSDLDNLKVRVNDPAGDVLVHLGSSDYLRRYKIFVSHAQEWRQQFQKLESVNLRYDNQVIVNPDLQGTARSAGLSPAAARAAVAAGVKPAALVTRLVPRDKAIPKPAFELPESKLSPKPAASAAKQLTSKSRIRRTARRKAKATATSKQVASQKKTLSVLQLKANSGAGRTTSAPQKPAPKKPAQATSAIPKPSPAIARQQSNQQTSQGPN